MKCKDGFEAEEYRKKLLQEKQFLLLLDTYSDEFPSIPDKNSGSFWDKRFTEKKQEIHYMEEDRNMVVAQTVKNGETILDLGIGKGEVEQLLFKKFGRKIDVFGTDITSDTLKKLKKKYYFWNFSYQRLEKLNFEGKYFDRVFFLEVLEHLKPSSTLKVLKEIFRVLKDDGEFVVSVPINEGLEEMYPYNPNSHLRVYSEELLKFELNHCGFKVNRIVRLTAFPNHYYLKKFINLIFRSRAPNNLIFICRKKA